VGETQTAKGKVKRVDLADHRCVVETAEHQELTLYTDEASKVFQNDKPVGPDALREGQQVTAAYQVKNGKNFVTRMTIQAP
jgi:hypothetical protein